MQYLETEATPASAGFPVAPLSWSNWNLDCRFLYREENQRAPRETFGSLDKNQQQTQPKYL